MAHTGNRTQRRSTKTETSAAMSIGKMQYPSTHSDWKKELFRGHQVRRASQFFLVDMRVGCGPRARSLLVKRRRAVQARAKGAAKKTHTLPPRSFAFRVTTTEPSQTMTKTPVKIGRD